MFGKPEWFVPKKFGWGLTPVTWQGWVYTLVAAGVIAGPFNLLLIFVGWPEAMIWMIASIATLCTDAYLILKAKKASSVVGEPGITFFDEKPKRNESLKTNRLEMRVAEKKARD